LKIDVTPRWGPHRRLIIALAALVFLAGGVVLLRVVLDRLLEPAAREAAVYGTIVGYEEVTTNTHVTAIDLNDVPAGVFPAHQVGVVYEDERVAILEQRADGTVRLRNTAGVEGWTQSDSLKDISGIAVLAPTAVVARQARHVVYQVEGTANVATVTFTGPGDRHAADVTVTIPWSTEFDAPQKQFLFISARNPDRPSTVTCTILVDGKVWKTDKHTGNNSMAVCDGREP